MSFIMSAPKILISYTNYRILCLINKLSKRLNSSHQFKIIPGTSLTAYMILDHLMQLLMNKNHVYTIYEIQQHKHFAFALYNLLNKWI